MTKRVPFPEFTPAQLHQIDAWVSGLDDAAREKLRISALKSQRYLRHEAAVAIGLCK